MKLRVLFQLCNIPVVPAAIMPSHLQSAPHKVVSVCWHSFELEEVFYFFAKTNKTVHRSPNEEAALKSCRPTWQSSWSWVSKGFSRSSALFLCPESRPAVSNSAPNSALPMTSDEHKLLMGYFDL